MPEDLIILVLVLHFFNTRAISLLINTTATLPELRKKQH
jgi:hypothetical protein